MKNQTPTTIFSYQTICFNYKLTNEIKETLVDSDISS